MADSPPAGPSWSSKAVRTASSCATVMPGHELPQQGEDLVAGAHPLVHAGAGGGDVAAPADDHADAVAVGQAVVAAGVGDGLGRGAQGEELVGLGAGHRVGHDAEGGGVEVGQPVDEAAPPAVEAVAGRVAVDRGGVEVDVGVPPGGGDVGDRVDPVADVAPEGGHVARAREDGAHPDDGHVDHSRLVRAFESEDGRVHDLGRAVGTGGQLGQQGGHALVGVDGGEAPAGVLGLERRRHHAPAGGRPRSPVDAHDPGLAQPVAPDAGEGVEGVVGGGVVGLAPVAVDAGDAAEQGEEAQVGVGRQGVGQGAKEMSGARPPWSRTPGRRTRATWPPAARPRRRRRRGRRRRAGRDGRGRRRPLVGPRPGRGRRPRGSGRRRRTRRGRRAWPAPPARPGCGGRWPRPRPAGGRPTR